MKLARGETLADPPPLDAAARRRVRATAPATRNARRWCRRCRSRSRRNRRPTVDGLPSTVSGSHLLNRRTVDCQTSMVASPRQPLHRSRFLAGPSRARRSHARHGRAQRHARLLLRRRHGASTPRARSIARSRSKRRARTSSTSAPNRRVLAPRRVDAEEEWRRLRPVLKGLAAPPRDPDLGRHLPRRDGAPRPRRGRGHRQRHQWAGV